MDNSKEKDCEECGGEGKIESFEDRFSHSTGHYTVDTSEDCEECDGTGKVEDDGTDEDS